MNVIAAMIEKYIPSMNVLHSRIVSALQAAYIATPAAADGLKPALVKVAIFSVEDREAGVLMRVVHPPEG